MDEILGFALSQEELLVALLVASLPAPIGFDDLETRIVGDLPEEAHNALLAAAERSMIARGFLVSEADEFTLETYIETLLRTGTQPEHTWMMLHQPSAQTERVIYFHQAADQFMAHMETAGIHQFIQMAGKQDIFESAVQLMPPDNNPESPSGIVAEGTLSESAFATIANSPHRLSRTELGQQLQAGGLDEKISKLFADTLENLTSITAFARFEHVPESALQRAFTIVVGKGNQWVLTLAAPQTLKVRRVSEEAIRRVLADFAHN